MALFEGVKVGDRVRRRLSPTSDMMLTVTQVTPSMIICGHYVFDRATGAEMDLSRGWDTKSTWSLLEPYDEPFKTEQDWLEEAYGL